jgi:hypothetical protein
VKAYRYGDEQRRAIGPRLGDGVVAGRDGLPEVDPERMQRRLEDALPAWDVERIRAWREDYFANARLDFADSVLGIADVLGDPPERPRTDAL